MLLQCFEDLHSLIDVQPHTLRVGTLKSNRLSEGLTTQMRQFATDICNAVSCMESKENIAEDLEIFSKRFEEIKNEIK